MFPRASTDHLLGGIETYQYVDEEHCSEPNYADFGDLEKRRQIEKHLLRKLDLRVIFLVVLYVMNNMNRSNVAALACLSSAARIKGLEEDLHLTGQQFNSLMSILRPSMYLSLCAASWGILSIGTGAAQNFQAALAFRFFLGFTEAVFPPAIIFILSRWYRRSPRRLRYKRDELGLRMAYFMCGSSISKVVGSLVASGIIAMMDGVLGIAAWRWLFFLEGAATCLLAVPAFYLVPDFPTSPVSWLTVEERMLAQTRMIEDVHGLELTSMKQSGLIEALTDWSVWWLAIALTILNVALSFGDFMPTLAATMGYNEAITLLLCAPPWILGVITSILIMRHSDATRDRFWHIFGPVSSAFAGFVVASLTMNTFLRYLSLFFMTQSTVTYTILLAWVSNSIPESASKRAVALAVVSSVAGLGDIGAPYIWPSAWGPTYSKSYTICILSFIVTTLMLWVHRLRLVWLNKTAEMRDLDVECNWSSFSAGGSMHSITGDLNMFAMTRELPLPSLYMTSDY
ncbi:major facilitator superfamily domain-containing protein [Scleroderma yunnanense]